MTFNYVKPTEEQIEIMQKYREAMSVIYKDIEDNIPASRGRSLALTKLEESNMWLNKAITHND